MGSPRPQTRATNPCSMVPNGAMAMADVGDGGLPSPLQWGPYIPIPPASIQSMPLNNLNQDVD